MSDEGAGPPGRVPPGLEGFSLEGRAALVTGGNRGLGRGIALALAGAGARVMVTSRSGRADDTLRAIAELGGRGTAVAYDVADEPESDAPVRAALEEFGTLDVLVNNAGTQYRAPILEFPFEEWRRVLDLNLSAAFVLAQAAARHMVGHGGGKIINAASLLSFQGGRTVPAYAAAKHGIAGLTKSMSNELAAQGVNVNAIVPGYIATDMNRALMEDDARNREILARIPAGRWGTADDVAGAAVFLASRASDYVHGHLLVVDGGWLGR